MELKRARIAITGRTPLLLHADNVEWSDQMDEWQKENKGKSKAGDDRTPAWRWFGCLNYTHPDTGHIAMPAENLMTSIMEGASLVSVGKGAKTFKSQSQSGLAIPETAWPIIVNGGTISMAAVNELRKIDSFSEQKKRVEGLGFELFVKRAGVNGKKHVRVRPRFEEWAIAGEIVILDAAITIKVLQEIISKAGTFKGLGDWRPSSKKPGSFGTFDAKVSEV